MSSEQEKERKPRRARRTRRSQRTKRFDVVLRERYVEVDKQTGSNPGRLHVGQQLRRVYSDQLLDALR